MSAVSVSEERFACAICLGTWEDPVTVPCGHSFCKECISSLIAVGRPACPRCREPVPSEVPNVNVDLKEAMETVSQLQQTLATGTQPVALTYDETRPLGSGAFGSVYMGTMNGEAVAVKKVLTQSPDQRAKVQQEVRMLTRVATHPNVCSFLGVYAASGTHHTLIVLEPCEGSLVHLMDSRWSVSWAFAVGRTMARALAFLHNKGVTHGDVKPENTLVKSLPRLRKRDATAGDGEAGETIQESLRLSDFDSSHLQTTLENTVGVAPTAGTAAYTPPEGWGRRQTAEVRAAGDVYALGVLLWELLSGERAWEGMAITEVIGCVRDGERPPLEKVPQRARPILQKMWCQKPLERPSAVQCIDLLTTSDATTASRVVTSPSAPPLSEGEQISQRSSSQATRVPFPSHSPRDAVTPTAPSLSDVEQAHRTAQALAVPGGTYPHPLPSAPTVSVGPSRAPSEDPHGDVDRLVAVLVAGTPEAKEEAAGALAGLASVENNRQKITQGGGIGPLIVVLLSGTPSAKGSAARALRDLAISLTDRDRFRMQGLGAVVDLLNFGTLEAKEAAAGVMADLASRSSLNRWKIATGGGPQPLIELLNTGTPGAQEFAAKALLGLAQSEDYRVRSCVAREGIPPLLRLLTSGSSAARENSARALAVLSRSDENSVKIVKADGISHLIRFLSSDSGTPSAKEKAMQTLGTISGIAENRGKITDAGGIRAIIAVLRSGTLLAKGVAVKTLNNLAGARKENSVKIASAGGIWPLVDLLKSGSPELMEEAARALYLLGLMEENRVQIAHAGGIQPLIEILVTGTPAMVERAGWALYVIAIPVQDRHRFRMKGIGGVVDLLDVGMHGAKGIAAGVLADLASRNSMNGRKVAQAGGIRRLERLSKYGSPEEKEHANRALKALHDCRERELEGGMHRSCCFPWL
uniref:RING-type E3 ubiquitin transferase n=1 Tax=Chromera velia CCMP2878 TaxID=1169474 RepID=A0A0G4H1L0_9ALVE|eukprot:Cvel_24319.t1-p1 / transcript=Cvel_24319.t1 / gene=Cvel_24319 / organism=Chromera_velia_CCMP2878 / gene_product=U-box domain-containing protein 12, putative / transcript_product=U-box domain-containing protein 12, putative / location=Cvel_scaffold2614:5663-10244(+) / protein_length=922 / sequence_SO=supercontig / SO=protein_coding / is_pseudo=false